MGDPIARVQNPYAKNIVEFVKYLPKQEMTNEEFRQYMGNCKWGKDAFLTSYYQICCQVGLYYIDDNDIYHPRFNKDITEDEATEYLKRWFSKYYVPNPYTKKDAFTKLTNPIIVEYSIYEYLKKNKENTIEKVCEAIFKEPIGNPDILKNTIKTYSSLIKIENDQFFIKEGADKMEINNSRNDKKAFFDTFDSTQENLINKPLNRIIFGAPGTGKSHKLETESAAFITQTPTQLDLFNIHLNNCKVNGDYIKFGMLHSAELKELTVQEISEKFSHKGAYLIKKGAVLSHLTTTSAEELPQEVEDSIKEIPHGKKESKGLEIGYNYCYCLEGATKESLMSDYQAEPVVADWILYGVEAATSKIDKVTETQISFMERVTFHPNYSYAQFVGTYKPKSELVEIDGKTQKELSYEYVPGPFMRVYVNAIKNPDKKFLLLIEEINRANVAAVFGDVFQLLDRKNGISQYPVTASEDQKAFFKSSGFEADTICIPSNMYLWATMNSADQGVLPMDAAFKRRWDFEYIGINEGEKDLGDIKIPVPKEIDIDGNITKFDEVEWNKLRKAINTKLKNIPGVNEDKLLGPFFIGDKEKIEKAVIDKEKFCKSFKSKVLMYLFEDVCKMRPTALFSVEMERPHYSDICAAYDENGVGVFGFKIEDFTDSSAELPSEAVSGNA